MKKLICALLTKFDEEGRLVLDEEYGRFVEWLIESGVDVLMPCGTNGEFHVMEKSERKALIEFLFDKFSDRVEIMPHVGAASFKETAELADHAFSLGAKRVTVVAPYYFKYDEKAIVDYYVSLAKMFEGKEILIYNIPVFTGNRVSADAILQIKKSAENITGLKDTDTRPQIVTVLKKELGQDFKVYGGNDKLVLDYMIRDADGHVSGSSNVFPKLLRAMIDQIDLGSAKEAAKLQEVLDMAVEKITGISPFVAANKEALRILGFDVGFPRMPLRRLQARELEAVKKAVQEIKDLIEG